MIRQALDTLPNCLPSSNTPTLVLITLSAVVISSLPSFSSSLISDYEDFIITVRLNCSTYKLDDRSNRSLPGRPRPHIQHGLLLEDPHSAISKTNGRCDENHSGITRNWRQYAEVARGLRGYGARHLRLR